MHIRNESNNYDYSYEVSKKPENKNLNRYRDVNPYDHSRVVLRRGASDQDKQRSDYINASLVRMPSAHRQYILAQGPLPNTTDHFWLMIWEQNCKAVIMLNRVIEKNQIKCHSYWPTGGTDTVLVLPSVKLKVQFVSETNMSYYSTRVLRLTDLESGESRDILHYHYTTWPDFGVPQSPLAFLHFLMLVRQSGALDENVGPPVVHCSAGIGRSGTFCLVDTCLVLMQEGHCAVNVRDVLMEMRRHRMGLIQTPDQLRFSYLAILEGARRLLSNDGVDNLELFNANHMTNEDDEDDDAPPPRPPPRGESLIARAAQQILNNANHVGENSTAVPPLVLPEILPELPPDRPLPCEPPSKSPRQQEDEEDSDEEEEDEAQSPSSKEQPNAARYVRLTYKIFDVACSRV
ncbi:hypothetical protein B566_EDAN006939 [Ephemera danica]|nr:hypothetical protein B566_EDAN006939 [Ephemera danica]